MKSLFVASQSTTSSTSIIRVNVTDAASARPNGAHSPVRLDGDDIRHPAQERPGEQPRARRQVHRRPAPRRNQPVHRRRRCRTRMIDMGPAGCVPAARAQG
jgi:hypothetical protein